MNVSIGTSTSRTTDQVVKWMQELQPRSICDVGCGWGRWGVMAREFLELWNHRYQKKEWATRITGIDINAFNWTPLHDYIYDLCISADVRAHAFSQHYDLLIATDVLEHMPKQDGQAQLRRFSAAADAVIVGVPLGPGWERGGFDNNPFEAHVARWDFEELEPFAASAVRLVTEDDLPYGLFLLRA